MVHRPTTWITVPQDRSRASYEGVNVRRAEVTETAVRRGMKVTTPLRTVVDCARELSTSDGVVIADSRDDQGAFVAVVEHELAKPLPQLRRRSASAQRAP
jgi:hypothetical protein